MAAKILETGVKLEKYLKEIANKIEKGGKLRVGFLEGSTEEQNGKTVSVPMIAAIQNYGAPKVGIPPRPFFQNCIDKNKNGWGPAVAQNLIKFNYDAEKALGNVGKGIVDQLKESISEIYTPELSEVTLMLRMMRSQGGANFIVTGKTVAEARRRVAEGEVATGVDTKPLIDSGQMQQAADFEVVPK